MSCEPEKDTSLPAESQLHAAHSNSVPLASTMGEIMLISMTSKSTSAMELRSLADWVIRPRLLGVPGVAQVMIIGGDNNQYHEPVDPSKLIEYGLSWKTASYSPAAGHCNSSGGFLFNSNEE